MQAQPGSDLMIMDLQTKIIDVIEKLNSPTPGLNQAQLLNQIDEWKQNCFANYLLALSKISIDSKNDPSIRILCSIQLKNALYSNSKKKMNANKQKWNQINQNTRNEIFTNTFRLLELADFKSAAPIALTYLCIMDTETNTWRQLVKTLEMNLTSQNNPHDDNQGSEKNNILKRASLSTLGYIAQEMVLYLDSNVCLQILHAVSQGIQSPDIDLRFTAATALCNVLDSVDDRVSDKDFRDQLLKLVITLQQDEDKEEIKEQAYVCLVKMADIYYEYLSEYIDGLFQITMQGMVNETNKLIVMHSIRFWTQICQKEYEILELKKVSSDPKSTSECQKKFYSKAALSYITPILLKHLEGNEGTQVKGWSCCNIAATCLTKLASCWGDSLLTYVGSFFSEQIVKPQWYCRNSAVLALGSVLEGPSLQSLTLALPEIWPLLMQSTSDQNLEFRDSVFWVIGKMAPILPEFISSKKDEIIPILVTNLDGDEKIVENVTNTITVIFETLSSMWNSNNHNKNFGGKNAFFYSEDNFARLIEIFIENIRKHNEISVNITSLGSISSIINSTHSFNFQMVAKLAFKECTGLIQFAIDTEQHAILSAILDTIQSIIKSYGMQNLQMCTDMINMIKNMHYMNLIEKYNIMCDILTLLATIVSVMDEKFLEHVPITVKIMLQGLQDFEYDYYTSQAALSLLSILSSFLMNKFFDSLEPQILDEIFQYLFKIVEDPSVNGIRLKCSVIDCFGDLTLTSTNQIDKYILKMLDKVILSLDADFDNFDDIYQYKYSVELYVSCMSTLTSILQNQSLQTQNHLKNALINSLNKIASSLARIAAQLNSNEEIQLAMIGLIGDLCKFYPIEMVECFKQQFSNVPNNTSKSIIIPNKNIYDCLNSVLQQAKTATNPQIKDVYSYTAEQLRRAKIQVV